MPPDPNDRVPVAPLLLSAKQAAAALAISERTLWGLTDSGDIPCVRIGRAVRYDPRDLQAYIDRARQPTLPLRPVADQAAEDAGQQAG